MIELKPVLPDDIIEDIHKLSLLKRGWYDGVKGEKISFCLLTKLRIFLESCLIEQIPFPEIGPTIEGEIITQWCGKLLIVTFCDDIFELDDINFKNDYNSIEDLIKYLKNKFIY